MTIDSISGESAKSYRTMDVSAPISKPEFRTAEPAATEQNLRSQDSQKYSEEKAGSNPPSGRTIKQAISDINKKINPNTVAEYGFHEKTNRVTIKIVDKDTEEVIREFPAEETLDMIAKVWELAGMFLDERG